MNDPLLVRGFQGIRDLPGDRQRLIGRECALRDPPREIVTLAPLAIACLVLGLFPNLILTTLDAPVTNITAAATKVVAEREVKLVEEAKPAVDEKNQLELKLTDQKPSDLNSLN